MINVAQHTNGDGGRCGYYRRSAMASHALAGCADCASRFNQSQLTEWRQATVTRDGTFAPPAYPAISDAQTTPPQKDAPMAKKTANPDDDAYWVRLATITDRTIRTWRAFPSRGDAINYAGKAIRQGKLVHVSVWHPDGKADKAWARYAPGI